jgi:hypothetical protein
MSENTNTKRSRKRINENNIQQMVNEINENIENTFTLSVNKTEEEANTTEPFVMIMPIGGESYGFPKPMPKNTTDVKTWLINNGYSERLMEILGNQFTYEIK